MFGTSSYEIVSLILQVVFVLIIVLIANDPIQSNATPG